MIPQTTLLALCAALTVANPLRSRQVAQLDESAFEEAQQRDDTAVRAFSNVQIKTADAKCLFIDELSGDFRANLNPVQIADCGTTDGQGWDVITSGKHNDQEGQVLIVNTLTQACLNFDPRRPAGKQVNMFSCGGRADGGGQVTNSQLFAFNGSETSLALVPQNGDGQCLTAAEGEAVDIAACDDGDKTQLFTFGDDASNGGDDQSTPSPTPGASNVVTSSQTEPTSTGTEDGASVTPSTTAAPSDIAIANPTSPVPVSRAGGTLNPSSAAEANEFDDTATRWPQNINIRAPNGMCLTIDPTAGDFRQNLIPIQFAECENVLNQKFDVVTKGKHNNGDAGKSLFVSALTQGCISFDGRRQEGDTVTLFSCGGRAAGEGETDNAQLYPFDGSTLIVLSPESATNQTCLVAGEERVESAPCNGQSSQVFELGYVS